jgi:hypothetical protein
MKEYVAGSKKQEEGVLGYYETDSVVYHEDGVTPKYIFHVIRPLLTDEEKEKRYAAIKEAAAKLILAAERCHRQKDAMAKD